MKHFNILLVFSVLTWVNSLTSAVPFRHLIFDPNDESLAPKETIVAAQLQVSPRADGTGNYELKQVPLISRQRSMEMILAEDDVNEEKSKIMEITNEEEENGLTKNVDADQLINKLENTEESSENVAGDVIKPQTLKRADAVRSIYITIPIYVNSMPGLPVTLSLGSQEMPLKSKGQGIVSRRQALEEEESPTSLYNKLL